MKKPDLEAILERYAEQETRTDEAVSEVKSEAGRESSRCVVVTVYDTALPNLPAPAALAVAVKQNSDKLWFAQEPLSFMLIWRSTAAKVIGLLDITLDPAVKPFLDVSPTNEHRSELVKAVVREAGSSGDFAADEATAGGTGALSPTTTASELRAATKRAKTAEQELASAVAARKEAERNLERERKVVDGHIATAKKMHVSASVELKPAQLKAIRDAAREGAKAAAREPSKDKDGESTGAGLGLGLLNEKLIEVQSKHAADLKEMGMAALKQTLKAHMKTSGQWARASSSEFGRITGYAHSIVVAHDMYLHRRSFSQAQTLVQLV